MSLRLDQPARSPDGYMIGRPLIQPQPQKLPQSAVKRRPRFSVSRLVSRTSSCANSEYRWLSVSECDTESCRQSGRHL